MMTKREYERISRAGRHSWFGVPAREGYTLLEVLMAVSLTTLLLAAITMTTGSFVQLSTRSRQHLQQAAMADCLVEDLMLDLKAVVRSDGEKGTASPASSKPFDFEPIADLAVGTERFLRWESEDTASDVRLAGNAHALWIRREGRSPRFSEKVMQVEDGTNSSTQQCLLWMSPSSQQFTLASVTGQGQKSDKTFRRPTNLTGLIRASVRNDLLRVSHCAKEVLALEFRYWNGREWVEQWNSAIQNDALPFAVEIRVQWRAEPSQWHRYVCALADDDSTNGLLNDRLARGIP